MTRKKMGRPPIGDEAMTAAERAAAVRKRRKAAGLVRRDVWALEEDWPEIRDIEARSMEKAGL